MRVLAKVRQVAVCKCGFTPTAADIAMVNAMSRIVAITDQVEDRHYTCDECKLPQTIRMMTVIMRVPAIGPGRIEQWWPIVALELDEAPLEEGAQ